MSSSSILISFATHLFIYFSSFKITTLTNQSVDFFKSEMINSSQLDLFLNHLTTYLQLIRLPINSHWLSEIVSSSDQISKSLYPILQPTIYMLLTRLRFFSPISFIIPSTTQQHAQASYYRLMTIAQIQSIGRLARARNAIRTSTSNRVSPLTDINDTTISHSHQSSLIPLSTTRRSSIFIKSKTTPRSHSSICNLTDLAISQHTHLKSTHTDDYLETPYRNRRCWVVNAWKVKVQKMMVVFDEFDNDELPPLDPSWI
ncbi:hypothetical protein CROQUDRAFT_661850 [Cronartium quercuum f. sp. fusiforme G11]|uniref:Uncharacterized protein n=1 Tax=Cronartium quercuum f. sp. fusiforme G11 TaxID=708437 RepID=A0A9P6NFY2_9BASI|nr:hypothetical protein CROQUDRAFT_661850 [Cronartium quercuum f. sp. fusiforme G11]